MTSTDGQTWSEAGLAVDRQSDTIEGVAAHGDGLVAVGHRTDGKAEGRVWVSPDGADWADPITIGKVELTDVLPGVDGLVVVGLAPQRKQRRILTLWRSPDGEAWQRQDIALVGAVVALHEIARSSSGVWLILGDARDGKRTVSRLWRSEDGETWEALGLPDAVAVRRLLPPRDLIATADGFLLSGAPTGKQNSGALWYSPDGLTWELVAMERSPISALATGLTGSYAFTFPEATKKGEVSPMVVLWSRDGREWCRSEEEAFGRGGVIAATVAPDGRVLAVGGTDLFLPPPPVAWLGVPAPDGTSGSCTPAIIDG